MAPDQIAQSQSTTPVGCMASSATDQPERQIPGPHRTCHSRHLLQLPSLP